jgi:hypothetical protein
MVTKDDAIPALSWSGESVELTSTITFAKRFSMPLVGITSDGNSALGQAPDVALVLPRAEKACPNGLTHKITDRPLGRALSQQDASHRRASAQHRRAADLRAAQGPDHHDPERQRPRVLRPAGPASLRALPPTRGDRAPHHPVKRPQSNGFVERLHRTLLDEHFRVMGRKKWYETIEEMQKDLDAFLVVYNTKRPRHEGAHPAKGLHRWTTEKGECEDENDTRSRLTLTRSGAAPVRRLPYLYNQCKGFKVF